MRQLVFAWMVILTGQSAASADDAAAPGPVGAHFLVAMRALVPAGELGGYEAFHLAVTRRWGTFFLGVKEESEHFGSGEGKISHESTVARWQDLAQDANPEAMSNLGAMHDLGLGVPQDWSRATELYRAAAKLGMATAQHNLGIAYALGRGVERDGAKAAHWLGEAAANGLMLSENALGVMHVRGWDIPRDERSGAVRLALAVRRGGFPAASRNLARLYEANAGDPWFAGPFWNEVVAVISGWPSVPKDPLEAYDWFDRAASDGFPAVARKRELVEVLGRASTEGWTLSFFSAPEDALRKEEELMAKIGRGLCRVYSENSFSRLLKILKNSSRRFTGHELSPERAYRYIRCDQPFAGGIDLIRVTAEDPTGARGSAQDLVDYFVEEVTGGKFLLGKIVMCERDFGYGCLNVFEHIEKNLKASEGNDARVEALDDFRNLLDNNLDDEHLIHDRAFCRAFFEEPEDCGS